MEILQIVTSQQASKQGALSEGTVIYGDAMMLRGGVGYCWHSNHGWVNLLMSHLLFITLTTFQKR